MDMIRRARAFAALLLYALVFLIFATPQLYLLLAFLRLTGATPEGRRHRVDRWQMLWMGIAFAIVLRVAGVKVDFRLPDHPYVRDGKGPFIVVANHLGGFDGLLLTRLLALIGRGSFRSIMKREVASWPIIGTACKANACAFVERSRVSRDMSRVEWCGQTAAADGASVLIFPEGTVFHPSKVKNGYRKVLQPKSGGIATLLKAMPGTPVLSVTIHWHDLSYEDDVLEGVLPPGSRVTVEASVSNVAEADIGRWLEEEWRRKDALLSEGV